MDRLRDGACRFCGQIMQFGEEIFVRGGGNLETAATLVCDCPEAESFQWKMEATKKGIVKVREIAGKDSGNPVDREITDQLNQAVRLIVERKIKKLSITINAKETVCAEMNKKGIKVSRTFKETTGSEVNLEV